jgi:hypothetical protein
MQEGGFELCAAGSNNTAAIMCFYLFLSAFGPSAGVLVAEWPEFVQKTTDE